MNRRFAVLRGRVARIGAAVSAAVFLPAVAFAQSTPADPFDTAMTAMTTKVGAYAAALVGLAAVSVGFMIAIKYVKKLPRAA